MTSARRVDKDYSIHVMWFKEHPKEMQFFIGDYLAKHPEVRDAIANRRAEQLKAVGKKDG